MKTIILSSTARKAYIAKRTKVITNSKPHCKKQDFGTPEARPCGFPASPNPMEKKGKRLGNIHKMYKFKGGAK